MLNKLLLTHKINKFYKIFGTELGVVPTHINTKDHNFLLGVQYDVLEAIESYDGDDQFGTTSWLKRLDTDIRNVLETPKHNHKPLLKVTTITIAIVTALALGFHIGRSQVKPIETSHNKYTAYGRYYTDGTVITNDGNEWAYSTDLISNQITTDNMPVWVGFDDNGTPNDITDDIILGIVYDRETAIYDELETVLSDKFKLERNDNNIHISILKEVR